jgi:hypothetical protein
MLVRESETPVTADSAVTKREGESLRRSTNDYVPVLKVRGKFGTSHL